jgi:hypothetical protein
VPPRRPLEHPADLLVQPVGGEHRREQRRQHGHGERRRADRRRRALTDHLPEEAAAPRQRLGQGQVGVLQDGAHRLILGSSLK